MPSSVTFTEVTHKTIKKVIMDWTSDGTNGAVSGHYTTNYYTGQIVEAIFDPDAGGTQPSDNYDVTVTDSDGNDVLAGQGGDKSNAATVYKLREDKLGTVVASKLQPVVANAGNSKGGLIILFIQG